MKKTIALLVLFSVTAFAQSDDDDYDYYDEEEPSENSEKAKSNGKETKFGIRLAYNGSIARYEEYDNRLGHGAEVGIVLNIPLKENLAFNTGLNAIYRTPINTIYAESYYSGYYSFLDSVTAKVYEYVLSIPVFFRYGSSIYAEAGLQADIPLKTEALYEVTSSEPSRSGAFYDECKWRVSLDFSIALGFGLNISENFDIGIRGIYGLTKFEKASEQVNLIQGSIGMTYLF